MNEILTKISDLKSFVRVLIPSISKEDCEIPAMDYFLEHLNELEDMIKEYIID